MAGPPSLRRVTSVARRALPLLAVAAVIAVYVAMDVVRQADRVEVLAVALYGVVLVGAVRGWRAGLGAGAIATLLYAVLRRDALDLADSDVVTRLIVARGLGYLAFGGIGGWLVAWIRSVVAAAGLERAPARAASTASTRERRAASPADAAAALGREIARARRRQEPLSVVTIDLREADPTPVVAHFATALRESDIATVIDTTGETSVTIVLPDTDRDGARVVVERLQDALGDAAPLVSTIATLGEQPEHVEAIRDRLHETTS